MGGLHQTLQLFGPAIGRLRREGEGPVIAPVPRPRKFGERHQLQDGDAELGQMIEAALHSRKGPVLREGADMQLVDDRLFPRPPAPGAVGPIE